MSRTKASLFVAMFVGTSVSFAEAASRSVELAALFVPPSPAAGCGLAEGQPNPEVSDDEGVLKTMALLGGDSFPIGELREAGMARYGGILDRTIVAVFRLATDDAAARAAVALRRKHPGYKRVFQKGSLAAMAWATEGSEPTCLARAVEHLEHAFQ